MTFRPNILLRLYRYVFLMVFVGLPIYLAVLGFNQNLVKVSDTTIHIFVCLAIEISGVLLMHKFLWEKFFAKLILTDSQIIWKCFFRKTIRLSVDICDYIGIQKEESHNGMEYYFIYLSDKPYPAEHFGKINKIPCHKGFIKFWYSDELSNYLIALMPGNKTGMLSAFKIQQRKRR